MAVHDLDLHRSAKFTPSTFDPEAMTVEVVASTFAPVIRKDARGAYEERLAQAGLDLSRLTGAPVLDGHRSGSARDVIGTVAGHRMEGESLIATIRLSAAPDAAPIITRIQEGTIRGVSVGYRVSRWAESVDPATKSRVRTAVAWTILEISAVAIPADPGATFRGKSMALDHTQDPAQYRAEIRTIARSAGLTSEWADDQIDAEASVIEARAAAFNEIQRRGQNAPRIRVAGSNDDPATIARRQADAMAFRMAGGELPADAREFVSMTLKDMAAESLTRSGQSVRSLSADEVFARAAHGTSDFPLIVSNAVNKVALESYKAAASPLKALARQRTLPNFKESTSLRAGGLARLEEMGEHGEFEHTTRAESGEVLRLKTFGRAITVSRKLMIDDDLGMLGDMTSAFGEAAAQTEAEELVALLTSNPTMRDGKTVFHASRGNLGVAPGSLFTSGAGAFLTNARKAMRKTTGLDSKTIIGVEPKFLVIGPESEASAEMLLAEIYPATSADVNPMTGKLIPVVEPRIADDDWYLLADPARFPALSYGYLSGATGVQIQRQEAWDTLGLKFRAWLDFGCSITDWRGAFYHPGA